MSIQTLVPQIWADTLKASLEKRFLLVEQWLEEDCKQHEQRMATDPEYKAAFELRKAEDEAWSYWDALYEHQLPELEEDDEWSY